MQAYRPCFGAAESRLMEAGHGVSMRCGVVIFCKRVRRRLNNGPRVGGWTGSIAEFSLLNRDLWSRFCMPSTVEEGVTSE